MPRRAVGACTRCRASSAPPAASPTVLDRLHATGREGWYCPRLRGHGSGAPPSLLSRDPSGSLKEASGDGWTARGLPGKPRPDSQQIAEAAAVLSKAKSPSCCWAAVQLRQGKRQGSLRRSLAQSCSRRRRARVSSRKIIRCVSAIAGRKHRSGNAGTKAIACSPWARRFPRPMHGNRNMCSTAHHPHRHRSGKPGASAQFAAGRTVGREAGSRRNRAPLSMPATSPHGGSGTKTSSGVTRRQKQNRRRSPAHASQVLGVIRKALPRDTIVTSDMTQIAYAANEIFPAYEPRSWIHPVGFGTLGFATPQASARSLPARTSGGGDDRRLRFPVHAE